MTVTLDRPFSALTYAPGRTTCNPDAWHLDRHREPTIALDDALDMLDARRYAWSVRPVYVCLVLPDGKRQHRTVGWQVTAQGPRNMWGVVAAETPDLLHPTTTERHLIGRAEAARLLTANPADLWSSSPVDAADAVWVVQP